MNITRLVQARRAFDRPGIPRRIVRYNIRQWTRSVRILGPNWLFYEPMKLEPLNTTRRRPA